MNIYNSSSEGIEQNSNNFATLSVQDLTAQNAEIDNLNVDESAVFTGGIQTNALDIISLNNGDILIKKTSPSAIDGLNIGNNNDILTSDGTFPLWTNQIIVNKTTTNQLNIPTTTTGDILVSTVTSDFDKLSVGPANYLLKSDGSNPIYTTNIDISSAILNNSLTLSYSQNAPCFTNSLGVVNSEKLNVKNGTASFSTILTQYYGTLEWPMINNNYYLIKVIQDFDTPEVIDGIVKIDNIQKATFYKPNKPQTTTTEVLFLSNFTGLHSISLEARTSSGTSNMTFSILSVPLPTNIL